METSDVETDVVADINSGDTGEQVVATNGTNTVSTGAHGDSNEQVAESTICSTDVITPT